jgi:hypothetical protein
VGEPYSFGFNGQEKKDDYMGPGNENHALYWEYETRTGRRWNLDPKPNPSFSDYSTFSENQIWHSDPMGDTILLWRTIDRAINGVGNSIAGLETLGAKAFVGAMLLTEEGREFLGQFATKGQEIMGYVFPKDGKYSDINLNIFDVSLSADKGSKMIRELSGFQPTITGGMKAYQGMLNIDNGRIDHKALKSQDYQHPGFWQYTQFRDQLKQAAPKFFHMSKLGVEVNRMWQKANNKALTDYNKDGLDAKN